MEKKIKIFHIIPTKYGGGVEAAARTINLYSSQDFLFSVYYIKKK